MTRIGRGNARIGAVFAPALVALAATFGAAEAQESWLVGTWEATAEMAGVAGAPAMSMTWTVEMAEDGTYAGSFTLAAAGQSRTEEMSDISVDGDAFGFTVRVEEQGQAGEFVFEGTMAEDEVSGTFEAGPEGMPAMMTGTFTGARAEGDGA
ncbi:MAG: hypothetical protein F4X22_07860 [Gemmatimonadales bacterium]|nr:hypothetical protein [Gemmatimonadales bacterium]MYC88136.1 hypothetical protein [Candidatus Palauibacter denitrificans]